MIQNSLWDSVEKFDINETSHGNGFALKLAREHNWPYNFTKDAVIEYKKFMYLAVTCDFMVSPSRIVDEVWHLHLTYSKSYNNFCKVLGKTIDHHPSNFTDEDVKKYKFAKEKTKVEYERAFGTQPPEYWVHYDMFDQLGLPKAKFKNRTKIIFILLSFITLFYPLYLITKPFIILIQGTNFIFINIFVLAIAVVVMEIHNNYVTKNIVDSLNKNCFLFNLSPLELIYLKTFKLTFVIHCVMNNLIKEKKIEVAEDFKLINKLSKDELQVLNEPILEYVKKDGVFYQSIITKILYRSNYLNIKNSMDALKKYFLKSKIFSMLLTLNAIVFCTVLLFSFLRLINGIERDKPIGYLFLIILFTIAFTIWFINRLYSNVGKSSLTYYYETKVISNKTRSENWAWEYFIFGSSIFTTEFIPLVDHVNKNTDSNGNSSSCGSSCGSNCGSSCGGGGDGGGCGGCGGGGD